MPNSNEPIIKPRSGLTARLVTETRQNMAKFFTETRQLSWVLLIVTLLWGAYAYYAMPKRKDPEVKVRKALAVCVWPGASAEEVEQQVTRKIEEKMAQNSRVETVDSISRSNVSVVYLALDEKVDDIGKELDDVGTPGMRSFVNVCADNSFGAQLLSLLLHPLHCQFAAVIECLSVLSKLGVLREIPNEIAKCLQCDVINAIPQN